VQVAQSVRIARSFEDSRLRFFSAARSSRIRYTGLGFSPRQIVFERAVMQRFLAGALQPRDVLDVFHPLQQFFVILMGRITETGLPFRVTISGSGRVVFMAGNLSLS